MNCKTCDKSLEYDAKFCSNCGAKIVHERISFKGTWEEFIGPFLSWDNNFWRTFLGLFTHPKDVLEAYINGARKKYFNPFSYLVVYASIAVVFYKFFPMDITFENLPKNVNNAPSYLSSNDSLKEFMNYFNFIIILSIPIISLITYFTFYKRVHNYSEHLVFNSYLQTNIGYLTLITQVLFINIFHVSYMNFTLFSMIISLFISVYAFKKLYLLNFKQTLISVLKFWGIIIILYILLIMVLYTTSVLVK